MSVCFNLFGCCLLLMIFVESMFWILSLFLSCSNFFVISLNSSGLFLLYAETYVKGTFFQGFVLWYFSVNLNPLLVLSDIPLWQRVTCNSSKQVTWRFLLVTMVHILCASVEEMDFMQFFGWWLLTWKYCWVSVGLWLMSVLIWPFWFLIRMSKNGSFLGVMFIYNIYIYIYKTTFITNSCLSHIYIKQLGYRYLKKARRYSTKRLWRQTRKLIWTNHKQW